MVNRRNQMSEMPPKYMSIEPLSPPSTARAPADSGAHDIMRAKWKKKRTRRLKRKRRKMRQRSK